PAAASTKSACAEIAKATASEGVTPASARAAAPAPACVAAPAGAIGSAAEAADAHRKSSASAKELLTSRAPSRTKRATARSDHDTEIRSQAFVASRVQAECSPSQPTTRKRASRALRCSLGIATTT